MLCEVQVNNYSPEEHIQPEHNGSDEVGKTIDAWRSFVHADERIEYLTKIFERALSN